MTSFEVIGNTPSPKFGWITRVNLWPKTGRMHQLRKHMAYIGHPILGDLKYKHHRKADVVVKSDMPTAGINQSAQSCQSRCEAGNNHSNTQEGGHQQHHQMYQYQHQHHGSCSSVEACSAAEIIVRKCLEPGMAVLSSSASFADDDPNMGNGDGSSSYDCLSDDNEDKNGGNLSYDEAEFDLNQESQDTNGNQVMKQETLSSGEPIQMCLWALELQLQHPVTYQIMQLLLEAPTYYADICTTEQCAAS